MKINQLVLDIVGYVKFCAEFFLCDEEFSIVQFLEQASEEEKIALAEAGAANGRYDFVKCLIQASESELAGEVASFPEDYEIGL